MRRTRSRHRVRRIGPKHRSRRGHRWVVMCKGEQDSCSQVSQRRISLTGASPQRGCKKNKTLFRTAGTFCMQSTRKNECVCLQLKRIKQFLFLINFGVGKKIEASQRHDHIREFLLFVPSGRRRRPAASSPPCPIATRPLHCAAPAGDESGPRVRCRRTCV